MLVLSGGAARGMAHLGFLKACRDWGVPIKALVGTSSGAIAGSCYANSKCNIDEMRIRIRDLSWKEIYRFAWSRSGIFDTRNTESLLRNVLGEDMTIEKLSIPFAASATSLKTRSLIFLNSGNLASAIAASAALPPIFTPLWRDGDLLVDGGVISILPVMGARTLFPELPVVSVDVNAYRDSQGAPRPFTTGWPNAFSREPLSGNWISLSLRLYFLGLVRTLQIEASQSDWHIEIPGGQFSLRDRSRMDILFDLGYDAGAKFGEILKD